MSYKSLAVTEPLGLGEGPHWDHNQQALFFVDIMGKTIHKYVPEIKRHTKTKFDYGAHFIIPAEDTADMFVVGAGRRLLAIRWGGEDGSTVEVVQVLAEVDQHRRRNRFNDGKVDPRGRLFAGTLDASDNFNSSIEPEQGSLYRIASAPNGDISLYAVADKVTASNGLAWDLKEKAFYYIDTMESKVRRYDYDEETGNISNQSYIFDLRKNDIEGVPDGMTIDTDGNLWIAVCFGSCVLKVDPRNQKLLEKIHIPAKQVTSVTFGGPNYDVLFVTTGSTNFGETTLESLGQKVEEYLPPSGATFMVTGLGVKGHRNLNFKV